MRANSGTLLGIIAYYESKEMMVAVKIKQIMTGLWSFKIEREVDSAQQGKRR